MRLILDKGWNIPAVTTPHAPIGIEDYDEDCVDCWDMVANGTNEADSDEFWMGMDGTVNWATDTLAGKP